MLRLAFEDSPLNFLSTVKVSRGGIGWKRRYQLFPVCKPEVVKKAPERKILANS